MTQRTVLPLLAGLALAATAAVAPAADSGFAPVFFNHAEIHVSPETYRAIAASTFVKGDLGRFEERSTVRDGGATRYSGAYLYGARTYFEFTDQAGEPGARNLAFGLWLDRQADLQPLLPRLAAVPGAKPTIKATTRRLPAGEVPWFSYVIPWPDDAKPPPGVASAVWVMSIRPGFLKARYPDLRPEDDGTSREKQYARLYNPERLLSDIDRITLRVGPREADWLVGELRAFAAPEQRRFNGDRTFVAQDTTFVVHRLATDAGRNITFHMQLNRPTPPQTLQLGETRLRLNGDRTATWDFPG